MFTALVVAAVASLGTPLGSETSSAMSFSYSVRSVGYSLGSAIGGLILTPDRRSSETTS
ncbi:hypothetical protein [Streptomyces sp. 900105245]